MRPSVWVCVLALLASMCLHALVADADEPDWRMVYARVARATLPIQSRDVTRGQWYASCTAVAVGTEWWTEAHCIDASGTHAQYINGRELVVAGIWQDIAMLAQVHDPDWLEPLEVADKVWPGQAVAVVGYGWGARHPTFATGYVAARDDTALDRWFSRRSSLIYFSMQAWQGTSGGPVVDAHGRLVTLARKTLAPYGPFSHGSAGVTPQIMQLAVSSPIVRQLFFGPAQ